MEIDGHGREDYQAGKANVKRDVAAMDWRQCLQHGYRKHAGKENRDFAAGKLC